MGFALCIAAPGIYGIGDTRDYRDELTLMKDFLSLTKKTDKPFSYWINQLIEIMSRKKGLKKVAQQIKSAADKGHKYVFNALKENQRHLDMGLRLYLIKFGIKKAKQAFEKRMTMGQEEPLISENTTDKDEAHRDEESPEEPREDQLVESSKEPAQDQLEESSEELSEESGEELKESIIGTKGYCALSLIAIAAFLAAIR